MPIVVMIVKTAKLHRSEEALLQLVFAEEGGRCIGRPTSNTEVANER